MDRVATLVDNTSSGASSIGELKCVVEEVLAATPVIDIHTHLFGPKFGNLGLWGIHDLFTYHYLEA